MTSACACTTIYNIYNVHALLVLYFCSQSVKDRVSALREVSKKMHPRISPRLLPESECKGTTFFNTDQIFEKLFLKRIELFSFSLSKTLQSPIYFVKNEKSRTFASNMKHTEDSSR